MPVQKPLFQYLPLQNNSQARMLPLHSPSVSNTLPSRAHDNGVKLDIDYHPTLTNKDSNYLSADPKIDELLRAIEHKSVDNVCKILDTGVNINGHGGAFLMTPLHEACRLGWVDGVNVLLDRGSIVCSKNQFGQTPLHYAVVSKSKECIKLLLETQNREVLDSEDKRGITPLHDAAYCGFVEAINYLLKSGASVNVYDKNRETPLHKAAKAKSVTAMMALIKAGASLDARDATGESVLNCTLRCFPGGMEMLLDRCIIADSKKLREKSLEVVFNYMPLLTSTEGENNQMKNLRSFVEMGQSSLLKHTVCESFLLIKWRKVRYLFFIEVIFYFLYAVLTTVLSVDKFVWKFHNANSSSSYLPCRLDSVSICLSDTVVSALLSIVIIQAIIIVFQLVLTAIHGGIAWLYSLWHVFHLIIQVFVFLVLPPWRMYIAQKYMCTIMLLLLWTQCMLLIGRFPDCGIYVVMFQRVAKVFLRIFAVYFCLLLAFTFSFFIVMNSDCNAADCPKSEVYAWGSSTFFKTLTMMIGELSYDEEFVGSLNSLPVVSHIVFLFFVILVAIILSNLLVALAVNDVQALRTSVHLERLIKQLDLVFQMEENFRTVATLIMRSSFPWKKKLIDFCKHDYCNSKVYIKPNVPGMCRKLCVKSGNVLDEIKIKKELNDKITEHITSREVELKSSASTISIKRARAEYNNNDDLKGNLQQLESNLMLLFSEKLDDICMTISSLNNRVVTLENKVQSLNAQKTTPNTVQPS